MIDLRKTWFATFFCSIAAIASAQTGPVSLAANHKSLGIELPASAFTTAGTFLSIDIDGYDVSEFAEIKDSTLYVNLDIPLDGGGHVVTVYQFPESGDGQVLLEAQIEVPASTAALWSLNSTLQSNYRADESPEDEFAGVGETANAGNLSLQVQKASGNWQFDSRLEALYDSENAVIAGDSWMLPDYGISAAYSGEHVSGSLSAGNIGVATEDLLFSAWQRRGAAFTAGSGRAQLQLFAANSTPQSGLDGNYFYPGDEDDESSGGTGMITIVNDHLYLSAGYIDGNSTFGGAGFNEFDDPTVYGGHSWNVSLDSYFLGSSIWLHAETAESVFDADGLGVGLPASEDDALQVVLQLSSDGDLGYGPFNYWSAYLQHQEVGFDFFTLGNMTLPGNLRIDSAYFQGGFDNLSVDIEVSREETNPDEDPLLPTQVLDRVGLNLNYAPATLDPDFELWRLLGAPAVAVRWYETIHKQPAEDALLAGYDLNNLTDETGIGVTFAREKLSWSLRYDVVDYTDHSKDVFEGGFLIYEPPSDNRNRQTSLQFSWAPAERIAIDAVLQRNNFEDIDFDDEYETTNYSLSGYFDLVPGRLNLYMSLSQGQNRNRFGDPQFLDEKLRSRFASMQLNWIALQNDGARPGLDLFLKGNWARNDDFVFLTDTEFWSIYLGAAIRWAGSNQ